MAQLQTFTARLVGATDLSELTKHLEFEIPDVPRFGFVPGQWLSFKTQKPDGEEITRAYSIASPPREDNTFALCLNRVQDGFMSNYLCDMKMGQQIRIQGPFGDFILRPPMRDTIFIATGTGIAPFRSMLHWLFPTDLSRDIPPEGEKAALPGKTQPSARHEGHQVWLVYGNRTEKDIYYDAEFKRMAGEHPNFRYLSSLSRPGEAWNGLRGYVQQHVPGVVGSHPGMRAYICGLEKMVKANRELLKGLGWDRKSILAEKYD
ncbi:MAG TPA: FAD-dependent oxidoreductase [Terriglobales bacterium]|nr:FAD-dependent oxidoreductase [Terriglobales bacterium]